MVEVISSPLSLASVVVVVVVAVVVGVVAVVVGVAAEAAVGVAEAAMGVASGAGESGCDPLPPNVFSMRFRVPLSKLLPPVEGGPILYEVLTAVVMLNINNNMHTQEASF